MPNKSTILRRAASRLLPQKVKSILKGVLPSGRIEIRLDELLELIPKRPLDFQLHGQLADLYAERGRWFAAIAQYRTSITLGNTGMQTLFSLANAYMGIRQLDLATTIYEALLQKAGEKKLKDEARSRLAELRTLEPWPLTKFRTILYWRMKPLADHLKTLIPGMDFSVLDVGGGEGVFALFIPKADYVLVEPSINRLSGTALPFVRKSFDTVISCHVLEHIPPAGRELFLKNLSSVARKYVLLLNPFSYPDISYDEEQKLHQLIIGLADAEWAKEHLALSLPKLEEVRKFATKNGFGCKIIPNGTSSTSLAMLFVDHYARLAGRTAEVEMINQILNTQYYKTRTHPNRPNDYLVELDVSR